MITFLDGWMEDIVMREVGCLSLGTPSNQDGLLSTLYFLDCNVLEPHTCCVRVAGKVR